MKVRGAGVPYGTWWYGEIGSARLGYQEFVVDVVKCHQAGNVYVEPVMFCPERIYNREKMYYIVSLIVTAVRRYG